MSIVDSLVSLVGDRVFSIILMTLYVSLSSTAISSLLGVPAGAYLGLHRYRFTRLVKTFTHTLYGLPPVVAGLLVYILLSRAGPLGSLGLLFTPTSMIIVQTVLVTPLVIGITASAVSELDMSVIDTARSLGASDLDVTKTIIHEARIGVFTAVMVGFGRAISEVGGVILVGGNIKWFTQVLTTSIVLETQMGNFQFALALGGILMVLALATSILLTRLQAGQPMAWR